MGIRGWLKDFTDQGLLSKWGIPDRILLVDFIPKTSVGKLDKKVMRQQYAQEIGNDSSFQPNL